MTPDWVRREASTFLALKGQVVASWQGNEMAVRDDPPQFGGPDVPCLQLDPLRMTFDTGMSLRVLTYQGDQAWSLGCADGGEWQDEDPGRSIFRRVLRALIIVAALLGLAALVAGSVRAAAEGAR